MPVIRQVATLTFKGQIMLPKSIRQQLQACVGKAGLPLGSLVYMMQGWRENCAFAYDTP